MNAPSATEAIDAGYSCGVFGNILGGYSNLLGESYDLKRENVALSTAGCWATRFCLH